LIASKDKKFISAPKHLDWLWGPSNPLLNGYGGFLAHKQYGWGIKVGTHSHVIRRLRIGRVILPLTHMSSWYAKTILPLSLSSVAYVNIVYSCLNSINITEYWNS
jgi:hypothetical protein